MKYLLNVLFIVSILSCAQEKEQLKGDTDWQRKMNADFKDATKSPLKDSDRKVFSSLDFFEFNEAFIVTATLQKTSESDWFEMKTTTSRLSKERIYGVLTFKLKGTQYRLNVYQGAENMTTKDYEDYLFLPFLDLTNGEDTYGGGRYIDLRIPNGSNIEIDFNKAYNPLCAYNKKYSCPIVPRVNYLDTRVEAGVKAFVKK